MKGEARETRAQARRRTEATRNVDEQPATEAAAAAALTPIEVPATAQFVLYLYGGKPRKGSFRRWLRALTQNGMTVVVVDTRDGAPQRYEGSNEA